MVRLFGREDRRRHELLSAYVDGEVTAEEAREVEDLLASSEDARRELAELQATVDLVRGLPELEPPRSFALDAAPKRRWTLWWPSVRATGLATSVAAMLLVGLVAGDMLNVLEQSQITGSYESEDLESAPAAAIAPPAAPESAAAVANNAAERDESATESAPARMAPESAPQEAQPESSQDPAPAMQQDMAADAPQADATESSEEPQFAMQSAMPADAPQADAAESPEESVAAMQSAIPADAPQADAAEADKEPAVAMQQESTEDGEVTEEGDVVDYYGIDDREAEGFTLPLVELQVVLAIVVVVLVGATLVAVLRRRRSVL